MVLGLTVLITGGIIAAYAGWQWYDRHVRRPKDCTAETLGVVSGFQLNADLTARYPRVTYKVNGEPYEEQTMIYCERRNQHLPMHGGLYRGPQEGDKMVVRYDPDHPARSIIKGDDRAADRRTLLRSLIAGSVLMVLGVILALLA